MSNNFKVLLISEAVKDLEEIVDWYDSIDFNLTEKFLDDLEDSIEVLSKTPFIYQEYIVSVRKTLLHKFPFKIFYFSDEIDLEIKIIAILHEKQDPKILKTRINIE